MKKILKPYFAKYHFVDGKIGMGDKFFEPGLGIGTRRCKEGVYNFQKVELFLCSKIIQIGDTFFDQVNKKWENAEECWVKAARDWNSKKNLHYYYKVLGKISPNALGYVKEGDEFTEQKVKLVWGSKVRKTFRSGEVTEILQFEGNEPPEVYEIEAAAEDWAERNPAGQNYGYEYFCNEEPLFIHQVKIKGRCGHFH